MFNKKKLKELEEEIRFLKHRIVNLENPYKYKIGDILEFKHIHGIVYRGKVVSVKYYNGLVALNPSTPQYTNFERTNYYTIFNDKENSNYEIVECSRMYGNIKKLNK